MPGIFGLSPFEVVKGIGTLAGGLLGNRRDKKREDIERERLALERQLAQQRMGLDRDQLGLSRDEFDYRKQSAASTSPHRNAILQMLLGAGGRLSGASLPTGAPTAQTVTPGSQAGPSPLDPAKRRLLALLTGRGEHEGMY